MFESLQESIEEQNKLLREILQKGGLETFLKDVEPVMPHINSMYANLYDYNETQQWVNSVISQHLLKIRKLYGEIKYLSQVIPKQYENLKCTKQQARKGIVHEDIDNFIERYEEVEGLANEGAIPRKKTQQ